MDQINLKQGWSTFFFLSREVLATLTLTLILLFGETYVGSTI